MRVVRVCTLLIATALPAACSRASTAGTGAPSGARVVDLGHALAATDPSWDGTPAFSRTVEETFATSGYTAGRFASEEHFGTHVDAPAHFAPDGVTVDRLAADRLVRPGICIDVQSQVRGNEDYRVTREDVVAFERAHGTIASDTVVLIATGWDERWPDAGRYMNVRDKVRHFPGLSVEAATLLARDRKVAAIGIDTPRIDYGPSEQFEVHRLTMPAGLYHVENAANLTTLPPTGFTVIVAPVKIKDGSGAPARVFALVRQ